MKKELKTKDIKKVNGGLVVKTVPFRKNPKTKTNVVVTQC